MDLLAAWLLYPLALAGICLGLALLIERLTAWRTPAALMLPVGFVALLALARVITSDASSARLALPVIGALALLGLVLGHPRLRALRPEPWLLAASAGVFGLLAAPVVLSGSPSFAGYLSLPDTSHQLALADLYAQRGPDWIGLPESANHATLRKYVTTLYPVAGQAALGVSAPLGVIDLAWLYQPFLAFAVIVLSLAIWSLSAPLLAHRWQAAVVTFTASQSALLVGNYLTGSIKEITTVAVLVTLIALVAAGISDRTPARSLLPVALAAAAALGALGPAALPYLAIPGLAVAAVWGHRIVHARRFGDVAWIAAWAALLALLALPMLRTLPTAVQVTTTVLVDLKDELGHLAGPLDTRQALGIWLSGDFRYLPDDALGVPQAILLWIAGISAIVGIAWAIRGRRSGPLLMAATFVPVSAYLLERGTTYADSKVLLIASPAVLLLAMLGAASLWTGRWRVLSGALTVALLGGVTWSTALAYHDVSLAPHERYTELLEINERLASKGPAILGEYDEFAGYFLRKVPGYSSPEYPHEFRDAPYDPNALRDPKRRPSEKTPIDMDDLTLGYVESVPYIILRRGPQTSRPPASFRLESRGTYYDVWRRTAEPRVLDHVPLGPDVLHQAARISEPVARRLARRARRLGGRIAFAPRARPVIFLASRHPRPLRWIGFGNFPETLLSDGPSNVRAPIRVPATGRYKVWVEGSFARRLVIGLDGKPLPRTPSGLNNPGAYASLGTVSLQRGKHQISIRQFGGDLRPGSGGYLSSLRHMGPIYLDPVQNDRYVVREIEPRRWRELVGVRADWLEIVRE